MTHGSHSRKSALVIIRLLAFFSCLFMMLITENSTACSRGPQLELKAQFERFDVVLQGKIVTRSKVEQAQVRYGVSAERIWKGSIQPGAVINLHTPDQGSTCGVHFEVGESYLIFADYEYWQHLSVFLGDLGVSKTSMSADTIEALDQLIDGTAPAAPPSEPSPRPTEPPERSDTPSTSLSPQERPGNAPPPTADADSEPPTTSPPSTKQEPSGMLVTKQVPAVPPPVERSKRGCAVGPVGNEGKSQSLFLLVVVLIFLGRRGLVTSLMPRPS